VRQGGRAAFVISLFGLAAAFARADDAAGRPAEAKTLSRTEDLVVLTGAELPRLKGIHKDLVRVYAARSGKLAPIPFQVDEKTPELEYCWTTGPEPVKDVDEGRVDDDDEVVFRAVDSGDRSSEEIEGATARVEVALEDPLDGSRGWAYVFAFDDKTRPPPARSAERHVEVVPEPGRGARLRTDHFEVACTGSAGLTGRPFDIRFRQRDGVFGPTVVTDAASVTLDASYLLAQIHREGREARTALGSSYIDGPVRILAPVTLEVYLIWGNWISTSRSFICVHDHTFELRARVLVPVNLDRDRPSEARIALERAPRVAGWIAAHGPDFIGFFGDEGGITARLELDPRLHAKLTERPELAVDLTGLRKSEETTPYEVTYLLEVLPGGDEALARSLISRRDKPLKRLAR
jgi:hypothetical protein